MVHDAAGARVSILSEGLEGVERDWRGIIVLLVKQVHLQNDGDASHVSSANQRAG